MLTNLHKRYPEGICLIIYLIGVIWRYYYLLHVHPATQFVYSDMQSYVITAQNFSNPNYQPSIADTIYPPGTGIYLGLLYRLDPSWHLAMMVQWLLSSLVPILLALIGYELYGKKVALLTLVISSLYFPFIDYASYFMSEGPLLFTTTLSIWCLVRSLRVKNIHAAPLWGLASGLSLGLAASCKSVVLLPGFLIALALVHWGWKEKWRRILWISCAGSVGLMLLIVPQAIRCTRLNEGHYCTISNNGNLNMLLGHYGLLKAADFNDRQRNFFHSFGPPPAWQMGYEEHATFPFGAYDAKQASQAAWQWIRSHPIDALVLSTSHIFELIFGTVPWPSSHTAARRWVQFSQQFYWVFLLLPGILHLKKNFRHLSDVSGPGRADLILLLPLVGLMITAFFTFGEPRFRIPFDGFMILLAVRWYTRGECRPDGLIKR